MWLLGRFVCTLVCMYSHHIYGKSKDQSGKVASSARGRLNRREKNPLSPVAPKNLVSRDGSGSPVPRQPAHLYTQAESIWYVQ